MATLVIGLGGTGKAIILALKKMIAESCQNGMKDYASLEFLSIDTDNNPASYETYSEISTIDRNELRLDPEKEIVSLNVDFKTIPNISNSFPKIHEWFPSSFEYFLVSNLNYSPRADRPIGRFAFAWNADELYRKLSFLLQNTVDTNLSDSTNVFICGSLVGGTGSGIFLDVAYMVRHIQSTFASGRQLFIYGLFALSSQFNGPWMNFCTEANCYASLKELDFFMNKCNYENPERRFHPAYKDSFHYDYSNAANNPPFDYTFLFDKTNNTGNSLGSINAFGELCAKFIYSLTANSLEKDNKIADQWIAVNNCLMPNIECHYNRGKYNKPINYYSMGTYSIMFPRRMTIQICAYKLTDVYLEKILDDSYNLPEITNLVERFMNDSKFNPNTNLFKNLFDKYTDQDSNFDSFASFIDNRKEEFLSESAGWDKKELVQKVRDWQESMEKYVTEFKQQNSVTSGNLRQKFLSSLTNQISKFVDLSLRKDEANRINNEPRAVRGSLVRAQKFVKNLLEIYTDAAEKYKKEIDYTLKFIADAESEYNENIQTLESKINKLLSNKKTINESLENTIDSCTLYLNTKRENLIAEWIYDFLTGSNETEVEKNNGLIAELETKNQILIRSVNEFKSIHDEVKNYLRKNKNYESNNLCDVLFDYKDDVEDVYLQLIAEKGEDYLLEDLSNHLKNKEENFGDSYENLKDFNYQRMLITILRCAEKYFTESVSKINISDKLLKNRAKLQLLLNGTYIKNASAYIGLDKNQLTDVGLNLEKQTYHIITIPDIYETCPCRGIRESDSVQKRCPVDEDEEKYRGDKACPHYPNCLKKLILDNVQNISNDLSIIPTKETAEIKIITTIAGYPLHAVSTAVHDCKPMYEQLKRKQAEENEASENQEEKLHVFGPVEFDDLFEKTKLLHNT